MLVLMVSDPGHDFHSFVNTYKIVLKQLALISFYRGRRSAPGLYLN